MTQREILSLHAELEFRCRGPLPGRVRLLVRQLLNQNRLAEAQAIDAANRGRREEEPFVERIDPIPDKIYGRIAILSDGESEPYSEREGCGYNFAHTIMTGPFDGQEHFYRCPRCGVTGYYQAPLQDS